ncbi:MAG: tetratricopeptide repeat protein [Burkholderiales bacterium]|nr:tetratricopeptide repeat protein [Burkholderiales bacterium]
MAQQLDLQEQEQVDALKAFWARYGNLIMWTVTLLLAAFAGWNFWQKQERDKALQASTMYGELKTAADAGDDKRAGQIFGDMKAKYAKATYTQLGGLLAAKTQADKGDATDAMASLQWVADAGNDENSAIAHLRLAGLLADARKYDDALKQLALVKPASFAALVSDRRGDIEMAQGQKDAAVKAWKVAYDGLPETAQYRILVEAKLTAQGAAPAASSAASGAAQ